MSPLTPRFAGNGGITSPKPKASRKRNKVDDDEEQQEDEAEETPLPPPTDNLDVFRADDDYDQAPQTELDFYRRYDDRECILQVRSVDYRRAAPKSPAYSRLRRSIPPRSSP